MDSICTYLLGGNVEVWLEGQGGLEPLTILFYEVEIHGTYKTFILIKNISLHSKGYKQNN